MGVGNRHIVIASGAKQSHRNVLDEYTPLKLVSGDAKISI